MPQYVYGWLKGRVPSPRNLDKLARDLRTTRAWLLFGDASAGRHLERPASAGLIDLEDFRALTERLVLLEAELDAALRAFPDLYLILDADGTILARKSGQASEGAAQTEAPVGAQLDTAFPARVAHQLSAGLARALGTRQLVTVEYSVGEGGEARFYEARFAPLASAGSSGTRALQIVREITERKRAEDVRRASEASFRLLVEDSVHGVFIHQRDFTIQFANSAAARILGYDAPVDLVGRDSRELLPPHERARLEGYARARVRGKPAPVRFECEAVRRDGLCVWVDVISSVVSWARRPALQFTFLDITERKRAGDAAAALVAVGHEIIGSLELDEVLQRILSTVLELFGVRGAGVFRLEADSGRLVCMALAGGDPERWVGRTLERGQGAAGRAVLEERTVSVPDVLTLDLPAWLREIAAAENRRSAVGVPLRARGRLIGALGLADGLGRRFSDEELALLESFADQAAIALENARLYQEARGLADQLQALNHLNRAVSAALGSDQALQAIADAGAQLTGAALAAVCVVDQNAETLTVRAHVQDGSIERLAAPTFAVGSSAVGWVAAHRQTLNIPDVLLDDRIGYPAWWRTHGLTSFLGLPIVHEETLLGVLWLCGRRPFRVGPDTERLLDCFVANAAVAIINARLFAESEARRREAAALVEVGHLLSETLDPEVVGQRITDSVRELFGTQSAALYRRDPDSGDLVGLAGSGDAGPAFRPGIVMPRGAGMVGLAVRERGPVFTADLLSDPRVRLPADVRERIEAAPYRAVLAVPLVTKEQVIGALSIADGRGRAFGPEDVRLVEAFAAQAALALENARLYAEATQRAREAEELARIARTLTESLDVATVADRVAESALSLFNVQACGIRLVDPENGSLVSVGFAGGAQRYFPAGHALPAGIGVSGRAVQEGKVLWSPDILTDSSLTLDEEARGFCDATSNRAVLAVPLRARGHIIGALLLADRRGRRFSDAEIVRAETLADQIALSLDNARLYEQQRRRSTEQALSLKLAQGFLTARDLEETAGHAAKIAAEALGADLCGVFLPEPDGVTLRLVGGTGWSVRAVARAVVPADGLDALQAPLFAEHDVVSGASVPMVAGDRRVGLMGVYWRSARSVSASERRLVALVANQTSAALTQLPGLGH